MIKTATDIERDVYRIVKNVLKGRINGDVYRRGMRPKDSHSEDCVVAFLSGLEGQVQNGELYIHIYVPYIAVSKSTNLVANIKRIAELEYALQDVRKALAAESAYWFEYRDTPNYINIDDIEQSQLSVLVTYKRYTFV